MDNFGDMKDRLTNDLLVAASSTIFSITRIEELINAGNIRATELFEWPELQVSKETTVPAVFGGDQYIDYPEGYRTDTMQEFIYVNSEKFQRIGWSEFLEHQRLHPTSTTKLFADYGRKIFLFPHQTVGLTVTLWGQEQAPLLVNNSDETIFSKHDRSGNEAIVKFGFADGMRRIDPVAAAKAEDEALKLLTIIWDKVKKRQQFAQPRGKAMFSVPDYFAGKSSAVTPKNFFDTGDDD